MSREILQRAETDLGSQDLANMSWALATLGFVMPEDDGGRGTLQKRGGVTNNVTTAPWLGPTLDALSRGAQRSCRKFNPQHLANTAWRAAASHHTPSTRRLLRRAIDDAYPAQGLRQA